MKSSLAVYGPFAVALLVFVLLRPSLHVHAEPASRGHLSLELPLPKRAAEVLPGTYDLVAGKSRFVLTATSRARSVRARTQEVDGWLRMGQDGPETVEWTVDLASLGPTEGSTPEETRSLDTSLQQVLGFAGLETFRFAGRAALATGVPGLPLQRVDWTGRADLGGPGHGLSMQMWHTALGNGRIHVQGVVELEGDVWRVPRRYRFGLLPDPVALTLGFDLEFTART